MAKYIVPFVDSSKWETQCTCRYCKQLDDRYKDIIELQKDKNNLEKCQALIAELDKYTVDGYGLAQTYESDGSVFSKYEKIQKVGTYYNYTDDVIQKAKNYIDGKVLSYNIKSNADEETVLFGRWCSVCGSRKPDVYDTLRLERLDLLPISSFRIENTGSTAEIVWRDSESEAFSYSKLFRNNEYIEMCVSKHKYYNNEKYVDNIEPGVLYQYYVVDYDSYNKPIAISELLTTLTESDDKEPPAVCTDVKVVQATKLVKDNKDDTYKTKNILYASYKNPTDADYTGTVVKIGLERYLPDTEKAGWLGNTEMIFEDYDIVFDKLYWIKPFPFDKGKWKHYHDHYEMFYNYNRNSDFAIITPTKPCDEISAIAINSGNREATLTWTDPVDNWKESYVGMREYTGEPITDIYDCKVIYKTDESNKNKSFIIHDLENGRKYQLAIFTISTEGVITICSQQTVAKPLYIKDSELFGESRHLTYMNDFSYTKNMPLKDFTVDDCFYTQVNSIAWADCRYELQEGATIDMDILLDGHTVFKIYSNQYKIFELEGPLDGKRPSDWEHISVDIDPVDFCRVVFEAKSEYKVMGLYMKNIKITYKTNSLGIKE